MDREYHRNYNRAYYHKKRNEIIDNLGGKCKHCGNTNCLEIDHISPATKSFSIGRLLNHSKQTISSEIDKCQLLCHDCHKAKSATEESIAKRGILNPNYGKRGSDFTFAKPVKCCDTGEIYPSVTEAANALSLERNSLARVCRGERASYKGMHFKYIDK